MANQETKQLDEIISSRRAMMTLGGAALAGIFLTGTSKAQAATITDNDVLNFALNLEYLEAQFYNLAAFGVTIDKLPTPIPVAVNSGTAGSVTLKPSFARFPSRTRSSPPTRWKPPSKKASTSPSSRAHSAPTLSPCRILTSTTHSTRSLWLPESARPSIPSPATPSSSSALISSRTSASPPTTALPEHYQQELPLARRQASSLSRPTTLASSAPPSISSMPVREPRSPYSEDLGDPQQAGQPIRHPRRRHRPHNSKRHPQRLRISSRDHLRRRGRQQHSLRPHSGPDHSDRHRRQRNQ